MRGAAADGRGRMRDEAAVCAAAQFRGGGVGKLLAEAIIAEARKIGYAVMRLDTVPKLEAATRLYESLGFVRRDAYYDTPVANSVFMELRLW